MIQITERPGQTYLVEGETTARVGGEFLDAMNGGFWGVVQIINHDDSEATEKELEDRVAPNVAGASGDQYVGGHPGLLQPVPQEARPRQLREAKQTSEPARGDRRPDSRTREWTV